MADIKKIYEIKVVYKEKGETENVWIGKVTEILSVSLIFLVKLVHPYQSVID